MVDFLDKNSELESKNGKKPGFFVSNAAFLSVVLPFFLVFVFKLITKQFVIKLEDAIEFQIIQKFITTIASQAGIPLALLGLLKEEPKDRAKSALFLGIIFFFLWNMEIHPD
ncbi:MAG: hypothetical protein HQM08_05730 [Candidatus Riflebacteria bacterium]|nr:hypothetical protein [Candidatus Riflebacteria bacterium]